VSLLDIRHYIVCRDIDQMKQRVRALMPSSLPHNFAVDRIEPLKRDGGSFVYFTFTAPDSDKQAQATAMQIVNAVDTHFTDGPGRKWYHIWPARSLPVKGTPFTEDIVRLLPSKKLKVEFNGPDLTVEQLYKEFREYGLILDIELQHPSTAHVLFTKHRAAVTARHCAYGDVVGATQLTLSYVQMRHESVVLQWFKEHTKFTIPLAAAALIAAIYALFDPIREFCVENNITHRFDLYRLPLVSNMRKTALFDFLSGETAVKDSVSIWSELIDEAERLKSILNEPPEAFVLVSGPQGSGKSSLVKKAVDGKRFVVTIDVSKLATLHSEPEQMDALAEQLGYWPVFSSIITITNAIDMMVTATTGSSPGFSATPESQVRNMFECLALVLSNIKQRSIKHALSQRKDGHDTGEFNGHHHSSAGAHIVPPDEIPVIILENFKDKDLPFDEAILEWTASIVQSGLAHCIATTRNIGGYRDIQRAQSQNAQSQRAVSLITLDDASPMGAIAILQRQLHPAALRRPGTGNDYSKAYDGRPDEYKQMLDVVTSDRLAYAASILGGRLEDLQLFTQKVKMGESVDDALEGIIQRAITEIRKHALVEAQAEQDEHRWSPEQFWYLLTELAAKESVQYDQLSSSPLFVGKSHALPDLEEARFVGIHYDNDRPSCVRPGRPVFLEAFRRILQDPGFSNSMTMKMNKKFIMIETEKIRKAEEELALLNVFKASADSHNALTSGMSIIVASREAGGKGGDGSSTSGRWMMPGHSNSGNGAGVSGEGYSPEAFIAQAVRTNGIQTPAADKAPNARLPSAASPRSTSWFGWLFGRSSASSEKQQQQPNGKSLRLQELADDGDEHQTPPSVIAGIPHELQGRVQFLLKTIRNSQRKIDKLVAANTAEAKVLSEI
ncbi:mitochondrial escape protein 2, partial [Dipsacomyces acuminosporus]